MITDTRIISNTGEDKEAGKKLKISRSNLASWGLVRGVTTAICLAIFPGIVRVQKREKVEEKVSPPRVLERENK